MLGEEEAGQISREAGSQVGNTEKNSAMECL